jgi:hypothetical protein
MTNSLKVAAAFAVATAMMPAAQGQTYSGVSHPDQVPVQTPMATGADGIQQPLVYVPTPAAAAASVNGGATTYGEYKPYTPASGASPVASGLKVRTAEDTAAAPRETAYAPGATMRSGYTSEVALADADSRIVMAVDGPANELPEGTLIKARIREAFSSSQPVTGQEFHADLTEAVEWQGRVLIPVGATLTGRVTDVHAGKRISGSASIHLQPTEVTMPDGVRYKIRAQVVDTDIYNHVRVDSEGTIVRKDHAAKTVATLGAVTGAGIVTGAVIGGVPGAVVGGALAAGVGTAVWLKQDHQTEIPAGTRIIFSLNQTLAVGRE